FPRQARQVFRHGPAAVDPRSAATPQGSGGLGCVPMKAVVCRELGPPERLQLEALPSPALAPREGRVAIGAAGINFPDIWMAAGEYQLKPELPFVPGMEAAGDVVEVDGK